MKITIKQIGDERWDVVASALNGESGVILATEERDGETYYNANFPIYGSFFVGVPDSVVEISE